MLMVDWEDPRVARIEHEWQEHAVKSIARRAMEDVRYLTSFSTNGELNKLGKQSDAASFSAGPGCERVDTQRG